jgi:hypothetical protein
MPTTKMTLGRSTPATLTSLALTAILATACSFGKTPAAPSRLSCDTMAKSHGGSLFAVSPGHPVEKVMGTKQLGRVQLPRTLGASTFVHAEPGLTKGYLERLGDCEAFALSEKTGTRHVAVVENRRGGFRVAITSEDRKAAEALTNYALEQQKSAAANPHRTSVASEPTSL